MDKPQRRLPPSIVGLLIIAAFIGGYFVGYYHRVNQEDIAAAVVVLEDVLVSMGIRERHLVERERIEELKNAPELKLLDECFTKPLPFNFDDGVQSDFD